MSYLYKCRVCGVNEVEHPGDVCEMCAIGADPYAQALNGNSGSYPDDYGQPQRSSSVRRGTQRKVLIDNGNTPDPTPRGRSRKVLLGGDSSSSVPSTVYDNDVVSYDDDSASNVQVYRPGQTPVNVNPVPPVAPAAPVQKASKSGMLSEGIVKNLSTDKQEVSALVKIFRALFSGIPFAMDDSVTTFQVFPDYSGTSLNAQGNACDQVIVYGKITAGQIAENNDVEIYGHRDSGNNIIASRIVNRASGTTVTPSGVIPAAGIWVIVGLIFAAFAGLFSSVGGVGLLWIAVGIICLTNLPLVVKIISGIIAAILSIFGLR